MLGKQLESFSSMEVEHKIVLALNVGKVFALPSLFPTFTAEPERK